MRNYNIRYPQCSGQTTNIVTLKSVDSTNKYSEAPGHCRDNSHRRYSLRAREDGSELRKYCFEHEMRSLHSWLVQVQYCSVELVVEYPEEDTAAIAPLLRPWE